MKKIFFITATILFFILKGNGVFTQNIQEEAKYNPGGYLIIRKESYEFKTHSSDEQGLWFLSNREKSEKSNGQLIIIKDKAKTQNDEKNKKHLKTEMQKKTNEIYYDPDQNGYLLFKLNKMKPR